MHSVRAEMARHQSHRRIAHKESAVIELRNGIKAQVFRSPGKTYAIAMRLGSPPAGYGGTDKGKGKLDGDHTAASLQQGNNHIGEHSGGGEQAKYIAKGKQLSDDYLKTALGHLLASPVASLDKQVSRLIIDRDVFAGRIT